MEEEQKLNTIAYRRRIAYMIYEGLVAYRNGNLKAIAVPPSDEQDTKAIKSNDKIMKNLTALPISKIAVYVIKCNQVKALVAWRTNMM